MFKKCHLLLFLFFSLSLFAQKSTFKIPDSLLHKSFEYLDDRIYSLKKDSTKAAVYLYTYLYRAKKEKNREEEVNAYQNLLHQSPENLRIMYADSMISAAQKSNDNALIGSAYLSKGIVYYGLKQQSLALDNYLIANKFISQTNEQYLIYKVKYHIALIKYYLGYYDESISLLKECVLYFKNTNPRAYLNSLHSLGFCYNKIGDYTLCSETNALGITESEKLGITEMIPYFIHSQGVNEYFKHNYGLAIKNLQQSLTEIAQSDDFANESIANFYIGKSYFALDKGDTALPYFKKVDKIFIAHNYLRTDLREVYEILINYYKKKENLKAQLYYIDQLLKADTLLSETSQYLGSKVHKEYDTVELMKEKEKIQSELIRKGHFDYYLFGVILLLFTATSFITYRYFKNKALQKKTQEEYRQKYDELMLQINTGAKKVFRDRSDKPEILDINPDAVSSILKQLDRFEQEKRFLDKDLTLVKLSAIFNSNTKYLSKIIYHYRDKGFVEYINDLKIEYVIFLLYNDKKTRNYTNNALAEESGFSSTQRFANAFYAKTGMPTSYFIEQIRKD